MTPADAISISQDAVFGARHGAELGIGPWGEAAGAAMFDAARRLSRGEDLNDIKQDVSLPATLYMAGSDDPIAAEIMGTDFVVPRLNEWFGQSLENLMSGRWDLPTAAHLSAVASPWNWPSELPPREQWTYPSGVGLVGTGFGTSFPRPIFPPTPRLPIIPIPNPIPFPRPTPPPPKPEPKKPPVGLFVLAAAGVVLYRRRKKRRR